MTKEEFYDKEISPLMSQVIALCREAGIPMLADFALDCDEGENSHLRCTTVILPDGLNPPEQMKLAAKALMPKQQSPLMLTVLDEGGDVKEMHAIL